MPKRIHRSATGQLDPTDEVVALGVLVLEQLARAELHPARQAHRAAGAPGGTGRHRAAGAPGSTGQLAPDDEVVVLEVVGNPSPAGPPRSATLSLADDLKGVVGVVGRVLVLFAFAQARLSNPPNSALDARLLAR